MSGSLRPRRASLIVLAVGLLGLGASAAQATTDGCAPPTRAEIRIDGDFDNWRQVLTNPANATSDGDGTTVPCPLSSDRDCGGIGGDGSEYDLMRVAWTSNEANLFVHLERLEWLPNTARFYVHLDRDRDGLMQTGEPVIVLYTNGDGTLLWCAVDSYAASDPAGNPLEDASGFADGHRLAGAASNPSLAPRLGSVAASTDRLRYEASVSWTALGMVSGQAFGWHVASSGGGALPNNFQDSAGGSEGRAGDTGYQQVGLDAERVIGAPAPSVVRWTHAVTNLGNLPVTPHLRLSSSTGQIIGIRTDPDGDANFDVLLATDTDGDGLFLSPGDGIEPAGDTNGDGRLDLGSLEPGQTRLYEISLLIPAGSDGLVDRVLSAVEAMPNSGCTATAGDRVHVGQVTLLPDAEATIVAGGEAWLAHVLANNTTAALRVDLSVLSGRGWDWTIHGDAVGAGEPLDAVALTDGDASGLPDVLVPARGSIALLAQALAPAGESIGTRETALLRALVDGQPVSVAVDELTVADALVLEPAHLLSEGDARYGGRGEWAYFAHRVSNNLGHDATVLLEASADLGWSVEILLDPDGDGRPFDAEPLPGSTLSLARGGGQAAVFVRVAFPDLVAEDTLATITLTATNDAVPVAQRAVTDEAIASIVRTYSDAAFSLQANAFRPCATVHALATGLLPSDPNHRFLWRDASGGLREVANLTTDGAGACSSSLELLPTDDGAGLSVAVERFDGLTWQELDRLQYRVEATARVSAGELTSAPPDLAPSRVSAEAFVLNESWAEAVVGMVQRWVLLGPDDLSYWDVGAGAFLAWDGSQSTAAGLLDLAPREQARLALDVSDVQHLAGESYRVVLLLARGCEGADVEELSLDYSAFDDEDGDGLSRDDELAAGTDPSDADSDDDGLLDGEDGTGDSDGDGLIDALDCDSDDDGLPDGLEAGVWEAPPSTDVAAGCFTPDAWPATTTDPDEADTDGGGVPDGIEDRDGNGRVDPGETDPLNPADDPPCDAGPPVELTGLRVSRQTDGMIELRWDALALDACSHYDVLVGEDPLSFVELGLRALGPAAQGEDVAGSRFYLVRAESDLAGPGPTGR